MNRSWVRASWSGAIVLAVLAASCGNNLPKDHGIVWECDGTAIDTDPLTGQPVVIAFLGAGETQVTECADPNVGQVALIAACRGDCKNAFRAWGLFSSFPFIFHDISDCQIGGATMTNRACSDPIVFFNGGPAQARLALDSSSIATVDIQGNKAQANVHGTIDATFGTAACTGPTCDLMISRMDLTMDAFSLGGDSVHDVSVQNASIATGTWTNNTTVFELPIHSLAVSIDFGLNNDTGSTALVNSVNKIHGTIVRDYSAMTIFGDFQDANGNVVHLDLRSRLSAGRRSRRKARSNGISAILELPS